MNWKQTLQSYSALFLTWVGLLLLFSLLSDRFFSAATFSTLASQVPALTVIAAGMTLVIIVAGIDLSVGSMLALAGAVFGATLVNADLPLVLALAAALLIGALAGFCNGLISVFFGVPSFIVTLGMLEIARGGSYLVTDSQTMYLGTGLDGLSRPLPWIGLPPTFFIALAVVAVLQVLLSRTVFGRRLVAIGTNERAVRLSGIDTRWPRVGVFLLSGLLCGLGALFYTARLGSADPNAGVGLELSAIAAVVIGGTSLMGGKGSVVNTFLGVLIIATLETGLAQVGASEPLKRVITGSVIVAAAALDAWKNRSRHQLGAWFRRLLRRPAP